MDRQTVVGEAFDASFENPLPELRLVPDQFRVVRAEPSRDVPLYDPGLSTPPEPPAPWHASQRKSRTRSRPLEAAGSSIGAIIGAARSRYSGFAASTVSPLIPSLAAASPLISAFLPASPLAFS